MVYMERGQNMVPNVTDFGKLLSGIPPGAWVAVSRTEDRVIAFSAEMKEAIKQAKEKGEPNPIIFRVPLSTAALVL